MEYLYYTVLAILIIIQAALTIFGIVTMVDPEEDVRHSYKSKSTWRKLTFIPFYFIIHAIVSFIRTSKETNW